MAGTPDEACPVRHAAALQVALLAAAKACHCYSKGWAQLGDNALLSAGELVTVAFPAESDEALGLSTVLDAVEALGDRAKNRAAFDAIVAGIQDGGAE